MPVPSIAPSDLTFTRVGSLWASVDPFTHAAFEDDFAADSSADYSSFVNSGTSSVAIGSGVATFSGASAGSMALRATGQLLVAPYAYIEMDVTSLSNVNAVTPFCGFVSGANDRMWVYVHDGALGIDTVNNGNSSITPTTYGSFTPPYKLCFVVSYPEAWAWVDTGSGYQPIAFVALDTSVDLRLLTKFSASWLPSFGFDRDAGASGSATNVRVGYVGGTFGMRDAKLVTYSDGQPYFRNGHPVVAATTPTTNSFDGNHMALMEVDLSDPDAPELSLISHLFYRVASGDLGNSAATKDTCTALYGGQIMRSPADDKWQIWTNGWGYQDILTDGIDLFYAETTVDILQGVHALDAYKVTVSGTSKSVYDNGQRWDGSTLKLVAAETVDRLLSPSEEYHQAYFEGTGPSDLAFVRRDTSVSQSEQSMFTKIGGVYYAVGGGDDGGNGGPNIWNHNLSTHLGSLASNVDFDGANVQYPSSGFCVIPWNRGVNTQYYALAFTQDRETVNGVECQATLGPVVMVRSQQVSGNEFPGPRDTKVRWLRA